MSALQTLQLLIAITMMGFCLVYLVRCTVSSAADYWVVVLYSLGEAVGVTWLLRVLLNH